MDKSKKGIEGAVIKIEGSNHDVRTDKEGHFWRLIPPGTYRLSASADKFSTSLKVIFDMG